MMNIDSAIYHFKCASNHDFLKGQCYLRIASLYKGKNNIESENYYDKALKRGKYNIIQQT